MTYNFNNKKFNENWIWMTIEQGSTYLNAKKKIDRNEIYFSSFSSSDAKQNKKSAQKYFFRHTYVIRLRFTIVFHIQVFFTFDGRRTMKKTYVYFQDWITVKPEFDNNDNLLWITTTSLQRPPFRVPIFTFYSITLPLNNDHLSTIATNSGSRGWSLYTGLTVYLKCQNRSSLKRIFVN